MLLLSRCRLYRNAFKLIYVVVCCEIKVTDPLNALLTHVTDTRLQLTSASAVVSTSGFVVNSPICEVVAKAQSLSADIASVQPIVNATRQMTANAVWTLDNVFGGDVDDDDNNALWRAARYARAQYGTCQHQVDLSADAERCDLFREVLDSVTYNGLLQQQVRLLAADHWNTFLDDNDDGEDRDLEVLKCNTSVASRVATNVTSSGENVDILK